MSSTAFTGNRNGASEAAQNNLRLPSSRLDFRSELPMRASADMTSFASASTTAPAVRPASEVYYSTLVSAGGMSSSQTIDEMDTATQQWLAEIDQSEATLEEMVTATEDVDFKDELSAIEQWFRVLSEAERTAALYALLQQTTHVQMRFFIQVLQQMAQHHPMSGILKMSNFPQGDPVSQKLSDAMSRLNTDASTNTRHSITGVSSLGGGGGAPAAARGPISPNVHRASGVLDLSKFQDALDAIAKQKEQFTQTTGIAPPPSTRNSIIIGAERNSIIDRNSLIVPQSLSQDLSVRNNNNSGNNTDKQNSSASPQQNAYSKQQHQDGSGSQSQRPISSSNQKSQPQYQPQSQTQYPIQSAGSAIPLSPMPLMSTGASSSTISHHHHHRPLISPFHENWGSVAPTPRIADFSSLPANQAEMVANATAMKLAAMSTANPRIQLDDAKKYRRPGKFGNEGGGLHGGNMNMMPLTPGIHVTNFVDDQGQLLSAQQQMVALNHLSVLQGAGQGSGQGQRSRPTSPGLLVSGPGGAPTPMTGIGFSGVGGGVPYGSLPSPQNTHFLTPMGGAVPLSPGFGFGMSMGGPLGMDDDRSRQPRGRSPRGGGRRGSSKPPEDPTDALLLQDIPSWLRAQRLHKYTDQLKDLKWQDLVDLTEEDLEGRGVAALGARKKLIKTFEQVKEAINAGKLEST